MSKFDKAVQIVHDALAEIQESGGKGMRASKDSLAKLVHTKAALKSSSKLEIPKENREIITPTPSPVHGTDKAGRMNALRARALVCTKCAHLVKSRTQVVFGVGNIDAELMFVGEAPGADEDLQGEPFVGKAGQLLTKIIETMGFSRDTVYIGNVLKCRPDMPPGESGNRKPRPDEMATCLPYLIEQIEIIQPRVMVALGATAMQGLIDATAPMNQLRGRWHDFKSTPLMATYHPAYLLRNQSLSEKRKVWEDMLMVLEKLGRPISDKQRNYFLAKG
ncbi:MAG: uracil-DNA glycosylase [Chthoniobacteraceae bacterium]